MLQTATEELHMVAQKRGSTILLLEAPASFGLLDGPALSSKIDWLERRETFGRRLVEEECFGRPNSMVPNVVGIVHNGYGYIFSIYCIIISNIALLCYNTLFYFKKIAKRFTRKESTFRIGVV